MTVKSNKNGHPIYWDKKTKKWYFKNGKIAIESVKCKKCDKMPTKEGHDDCISNLPGVKNACCGHGEEGYIFFTDGTVIRGVFSIERLIDYFPTTEEGVEKFEKENKELIDNIEIPEHLSAENILKKKNRY